jgi:heme-degrading monooxygenase HmoA
VKTVPSFAVIFISQRTPGDNGYGEAAARMEELGSQQPGFLGIDSARGADGKGITVAFYESEEAARAWGRNPEHQATQRHGKENWYERFEIYYAQVERGREWKKS